MSASILVKYLPYSVSSIERQYAVISIVIIIVIIIIITTIIIIIVIIVVVVDVEENVSACEGRCVG